MRRMLSFLIVVVLMVVTLPVSAQNASSGKAANNGQQKSYIIQMIEDPVVAYKGGISGLKATKPGKNQKINPNSPSVVNYVSYLTGRHDQVLNSVGGGKKLYSYVYSFNGFAAQLTPEQAAKLAATNGVVAVSEDRLQQLDTTSTPDFLGLTAPGGLWDQLGGFGSAGENVIVGIVDSGIWPENPSFSDRTGLNGNETQDGKLDYQQIPGWHGRCVPGEDFTASDCNQKIIGARYYNAGYGGNEGVDAQFPEEYLSPRDLDGHGTHTASTAAGNYNTPTNGAAAVFGTVSGIAPRARIAVYKVCWGAGDSGGCFNTDSVAAIDQAVADGVDVINFSISGTSTNFMDPVEVAFLFAADAGVFVAASAGNSGPTTSTVAHPSPWLTTVAAGTHSRDGQGSVTLGDGMTYYGASLANPVGPAPLINSVDAGLPGANPTAVALCFAAVDNGGVAVLDPAKVAGKIVVCDRGVTARVNKSLAVKEAGGVGMILVNTSINSINADFHFVPSVHVQSTSRAAIMAYAATAGATATINQAVVVNTAPAPFTASFSSRGPLLASGGDLLKPDVIAPGQDILAAVSPVGHSGNDFDLLSGTSMSSPHVAGLGALLKDLHPDWSPMAIKSALMTSAYDVLDGPNNNPLVIFRQGAGHVRPNSAADPGLVFDAGWVDWLGFLCGTGQLTAAYCPSIRIDPSNLNTASIAIGDLAGSQTVTRKVTNVGGKETYTMSKNITGLDVSVSPPSFTLNPGQTQALSITIKSGSAVLNAYAGGYITWTGDKGHVVRIPLVARPLALSAPASVSSTGAPVSYNVTFGYSGDFTATARGLVPAAITSGTVADDPTDGTCSLSSPNAQLITMAVPAGTTYARFALFDADVAPGADIDLCVFRGESLVGASGSGTSAEQVNLLNPAAGDYTVVVQGWGVNGSSPFVLHTWLLGSSAAGNMTVSAPTSAVASTSGTITLNFSGLEAGKKYLGSIAYGGASGMPNPTIVTVNP